MKEIAVVRCLRDGPDEEYILSMSFGGHEVVLCSDYQAMPMFQTIRFECQKRDVIGYDLTVEPFNDSKPLEGRIITICEKTEEEA